MRERPSAATIGRAVGAPTWRAVISLLAWADRTRERRQLRDLDDRLLKDIGLTRSDVERECAKPFWRP
jgi:uncharacterized protein YjiS (DUF1127 family)